MKVFDVSKGKPEGAMFDENYKKFEEANIIQYEFNSEFQMPKIPSAGRWTRVGRWLHLAPWWCRWQV
jgi:hypothetical protein